MAFDDQCGKVIQLRGTVCILPDAFEQRIECCLRRLAVMMRDHFADARFAQLLAGSATEDLLGKTEFALRDAVLKLGAKTLEGAANERAKKRLPREQYRLQLRRINPLRKLAIQADS